MEGGFFLAETGWEFLLPSEVQQLRHAEAVCRKRWDFLALTSAGCSILAGERAAARLLLLPGEWTLGQFCAERVVTYGLSPRDSITLSSLTEPVLCIQRTLPLLCGGELEPREFPLPGVTAAQTLLPCIAVRLLWTGAPYLP